MKQWFIGAVLVIVGGVVLGLWGVDARTRTGADEWLAPSVIAGQLLAVGSWVSLLASGVGILWRAARFTTLLRTGEELRARAHPVVVLGGAFAAVGFTVAALGAAYGLVWGDGDAPLIFAAAGPVMLAFWVLVSVCALAGRIWWPAIEADAEWIVVSGFFERTTFRRARANVAADNGGSVVRGTPHRRERSPLSVVFRYRGSTVMLPTIRLNCRALAALKGPGAAWPGSADPHIVVPPG